MAGSQALLEGSGSQEREGGGGEGYREEGGGDSRNRIDPTWWIGIWDCGEQRKPFVRCSA